MPIHDKKQVKIDAAARLKRQTDAIRTDGSDIKRIIENITPALSEHITDLCNGHNKSFTPTQIEVLKDIAIHVSAISIARFNEYLEEQKEKTVWARVKRNYKKVITFIVALFLICMEIATNFENFIKIKNYFGF